KLKNFKKSIGRLIKMRTMIAYFSRTGVGNQALRLGDSGARILVGGVVEHTITLELHYEFHGNSFNMRSERCNIDQNKQRRERGKKKKKEGKEEEKQGEKKKKERRARKREKRKSSQRNIKKHEGTSHKRPPKEKKKK